MPLVWNFVVGVVVVDCEGCLLDWTALSMLEEFGILSLKVFAIKETYGPRLQRC
jgi:hypothetical protein